MFTFGYCNGIAFVAIMRHSYYTVGHLIHSTGGTRLADAAAIALKQKKIWNPFLYQRIYNLTPRNTANYQIAPSVLQIYYTLIIVRRKREFLMLVSNFGDRFSP